MEYYIPDNIKGYIANEENVPLVERSGVKWYSITQEEKNSLQELLQAIDSTPENEWRTWEESEILKWCGIGNTAARIVKNCIIRE